VKVTTMMMLVLLLVLVLTPPLQVPVGGPGKVPPSKVVHFRGLRNLDATLDWAFKHGLADATELVVTGGSAGGLSTFLHVDRIAARMRASAPMCKLISAAPVVGYFLDHSTFAAGTNKAAYPPGTNYSTNMKTVFTNQNITAALMPACLAAFPASPHLCFMSPHMNKFVKVMMPPDNECLLLMLMLLVAQLVLTLSLFNALLVHLTDALLLVQLQIRRVADGQRSAGALQGGRGEAQALQRGGAGRDRAVRRRLHQGSAAGGGERAEERRIYHLVHLPRLLLEHAHHRRHGRRHHVVGILRAVAGGPQIGGGGGGEVDSRRRARAERRRRAEGPEVHAVPIIDTLYEDLHAWSTPSPCTALDPRRLALLPRLHLLPVRLRLLLWLLQRRRLSAGVLTVHSKSRMSWKLYSSVDGSVLDSFEINRGQCAAQGQGRSGQGAGRGRAAGAGRAGGQAGQAGGGSSSGGAAGRGGSRGRRPVAALTRSSRD